MDKYEIEEKVQGGSINCRITIEILGSPKEYVEKTLQIVLERLSKEKGVTIISEQKHPAQEQEKMFSTYAEIELLFQNFETLTRISFDYMPSSIEILKPSDFKLSSLDLSNFISDNLSLLHEIEFKLKDINANNKILQINSNNLLKNLLALALENGEQEISQLSEATGITSEQLENFLEKFRKEKFLTKEGEKWALAKNDGKKKQN